VILENNIYDRQVSVVEPRTRLHPGRQIYTKIETETSEFGVTLKFVRIKTAAVRATKTRFRSDYRSPPWKCQWPGRLLSQNKPWMNTPFLYPLKSGYIGIRVSLGLARVPLVDQIPQTKTWF
jgi:hypothetical protein